MNRRLRSIDVARERRLRTLGAGYSSFVRIAKLALPLFALVIIGIVMSDLSETPVQQQIAALPREEQTAPGESELVKAQYEGVDAEGQKYTLTADRATRKDGEPDAATLEEPRADITLRDGTWLAVHAKRGFFDNKTATLDLSGNVTVFHDAGYELVTENMRVLLGEKKVTALTPVRGQGPLGEIRARNMSVLEGGMKVVFGGPATLTLRLGSGDRG